MKDPNTATAVFLAALLTFPGSIHAVAHDTGRSKEIGNVVVVGWDGTQREHLLVMLSSGQLPNLGKLAGEGSLVFTEATTGATATKPGWTEILTGYSAIRLGIPGNRKYKPIPKGYTVFERLKKFFGPGNISTIFITGKINNLGARGPHEICVNCISREAVERRKTQYWSKEDITTARTRDGKPPVWARREGEPYFNSKSSLDLYSSALGPAENVAGQALAALDKYHKAPFFAFFHFEEPDEPGHLYGENSKEYDEAIKTADRWLGEIVKKLDSLGISGKTTIYVTADHGMDEDGFDHRDAPYMFLATNNKSKLKAGDRKDITPTILEAYGLDLKRITPPMDGKSLIIR